MASTSGTTIFNLDLSELVEEAFERCGSQLRSGYDLRTARRSLNLMSIEWANRGINLWTVEECSIQLTTNQGIYNVPTDTIDILDLETRTLHARNQSELQTGESLDIRSVKSMNRYRVPRGTEGPEMKGLTR